MSRPSLLWLLAAWAALLATLWRDPPGSGGIV